MLAYGYSADGQKREKRFNNTIAQHYRGSMVYAGDGTPEYVLVPEGMVRNVSRNWVRQYNVTDHLGNTRVVLEPNSNVLQQTDYYPFGAAFAAANTTKNKYLYGGKEYQDEVLGGTLLGLYDFEARFADVRIGRFGQIDILAEDFYSTSPYAYCLNNPINIIDPTGMFAEVVYQSTRYEDENGNLLLNTNDGSSAIVTVPKDRMSDFIWAVAHTSEENINSQEWNRAWVKSLTGITMTDDYDYFLNQCYSDAMKRAYMEFFKTGDQCAILRAAPAEVGKQWLTPSLSIPAVLAGIVGVASVNKITIRSDIALSGGRSGQMVKALKGPPNSAVKGSNGRIYITDETGNVIWDVTKDRAKSVIPGTGFGPKVTPTQEQLNLINKIWGK